MSLEVALAVSDKELKDAFSIRYDVFAKEGGWIPLNSEELEMDLYDHSPGTLHFVAYDDDVPVGTSRIVLSNQKRASAEGTTFGLRLEKDFVLSPLVSLEPYSVAELSRSAVLKDYRTKPVLLSIYAKIIEYVHSYGVEEIVAGVNPDTDNLEHAHIMYDLAKKLNYSSLRMRMVPLHSTQDTSSICPFYEPEEIDEVMNLPSMDIPKRKFEKKLPPVPRMVSTKLGILFSGEPAYDNSVKMCSLPMSWPVNIAKNNSLLNRVNTSLPPLRNHVHKSYFPLASYAR